jgi:hypothetical protein
MLVIKKSRPGESVYGGKRISIDTSSGGGGDGADGATNGMTKVEYRYVESVPEPTSSLRACWAA